MLNSARWRTLIAEVRLVGGSSLKTIPLIFFFMLISVFLELSGVILIAPFVGLLMGNSLSMLPAPILSLLGSDPLKTVGILIVVVYLTKAIATLILQGTITRMSETIRGNVMTRLLDAYQHRPYRIHLEQPSSDLINRLLWYSNAFATGFVGATLRFLSDALVFLVISVTIALANPKAMLLLGTVLVLVFTFVQFYIKDRLARASAIQARMTSEVMHSSTQALAGLREVRILGCESYFLARLTAACRGLVEGSRQQTVLTMIPRQSIEFTMVTFIVVLVFLSRYLNADDPNLLPFLGLMGAAAIRLMPASTSLLTSFNQVRSNRFAVGALARDLSQRGESTTGVPQLNQLLPATKSQLKVKREPFTNLSVRGISFAYSSKAPKVIDNLSFDIKAGETVGLVGNSGAGKSTLADLLLGFLEPTNGEIYINGSSLKAGGVTAMAHWQSMVAYIPQQSYLTDDTLRRNVALGVHDEEIDDAAVIKALEDAQLGAVLRQLPNGLDTELGERGVRFSGGQRQRVSIARALYHDREFLVLDEATSALDVETEREIVETIRALSGRKTILLIAHRETTLAVCSRLLRLGAQQKTPMEIPVVDAKAAPQ
jgi:ATP-binding cassette, subfamily B, bacterial PglK